MLFYKGRAFSVPAESVTLTPIDGGFSIELIGQIAKMITLPARTGSAEINGYVSSVKVVAGARNYLNLLLSAEVALP